MKKRLNKTLPSLLPWTAEIDGNDLVVRNIYATCFGGAYDDEDTGQTESGWNNTGDGSKEAETMQVALPIRSTEKVTQGSPLAFKGPHIPWETVVMVWLESEEEATAIKCILTDNGPDEIENPSHALDMNPPAALHFAPSFDPKKIANDWSGSGFSYRIINGAKWIS